MSKNIHVQSLMEQFPNEGLTFDDVSLITRYADFLPDEADITTKLTNRISANMPFVSAAMDTVTEAEMAIAMALLGGIGVIHKNLSVQEQTRQVGIVKHHLNGLIRNPVVFHSTDTIEVISTKKEQEGFSFSGFPILDDKDNLVGILTSTDIKFSRSANAKAVDIMTKDPVTIDADEHITLAMNKIRERKIRRLPVVDNGKLVGIISLTDLAPFVVSYFSHR